jgi:hypothetical protein
MVIQDNDFPIYIAFCDVGRGVFAATDIAEGDVILRFIGPRISLAEALAKGSLHCNPLQVENDQYIDLQEPGVLVNHSCDPNSGIVDDVVLVALRSIHRGEEVRCDYSTSMADGTWELVCQCKAAGCRGVVRDFEFLPPSVRTRYLGLGIVQSFIARQQRHAEQIAAADQNNMLAFWNL